jgi:aminomethyltransferase
MPGFASLRESSQVPWTEGANRIWRLDSDSVLNGKFVGDDQLLKTPLHDLHVAHGGRLVPFAGYALPVQYPTGIMAEHLWTRENAGLFDVSHMGQLTVKGPGVDTLLEALMPGDFIGLKQDHIRYSLLLNQSGGILDDLMVTRRADDFLLIVNGAVKHEDIAHMKAHSLPLVYHDDRALLALQGPKAVDALIRILPDVAALKFMQAVRLGWLGLDLWISRSGYTGEDGFEISVPASGAVAFAQLLLDQPEVKPVGLGARDSLRLEAGLPLYGHDATPQINPAEADLAFAISKRRKAEGGFPGAEKILGQLLHGAATQRVGLRIDGRLPAREGAEIYVGDVKIGTLTSGGFAPTLGCPIAMGYIAKPYAAHGTAIEIDVRGKRIAATVVPMPFVPHRYFR